MPTTTAVGETPIFDNWTSLSFKRAMGNRTQPGQSWMAPGWVGEHNRRLTAYMILQSYFDNSARIFLKASEENTYADDHREYGDAVTLRDTILAAVLGDDQTIVVEGADQDPDAVVEVEGEDGTVQEMPPENQEDIIAAQELQEWLEDLAWNKERLGLKMIETERNAIGLGDGIYVLGYSPEKKRVRLRVFDPGYYFPVLTDGNEDDFPERVHIAWEVEQPDRTQRHVRRITWELVHITDPRVIGPAANPRRVEYQDDLVTKTCLMTDATWVLDATRAVTVDDLAQSRAIYETYTDDAGEVREWKDLDLRIDFIPVIHEPNTVAILHHYGKSSIERILQILDDISNADTDLQAASATTGKPPVAISNSITSRNQPTWKAGDLWELGPDGRATVVDTSRSLDALIKYVEFLLGRLEVSSRVPGSVVGRMESGETKSGIHLALTFGPLIAMINEMRLPRMEVYPLLLKFWWRMSIQNRVEGTPKRWFPSRIEFGSFLPHDVAGVVEIVTGLLKAKAIGRRTAIRLLVAAGVDIQDAEAEVKSIQSTDFEGAKNMAEALANEEPAAEYLGVEIPTPAPEGAPPIPPPVLPTPEQET